MKIRGNKSHINKFKILKKIIGKMNLNNFLQCMMQSEIITKTKKTTKFKKKYSIWKDVQIALKK
jgi:hypothetical protein